MIRIVKFNSLPFQSCSISFLFLKLSTFCEAIVDSCLISWTIRSLTIWAEHHFVPLLLTTLWCKVICEHVIRTFGSDIQYSLFDIRCSGLYRRRVLCSQIYSTRRLLVRVRPRVFRLFLRRDGRFFLKTSSDQSYIALFLITGAYAIHPPFAILHRYKSRARFLAKRGKTSKAKPRFSRDWPLTRSDKNSKRNTLNATFSNDQTTFCSMKDSV